MSAHRSGCLSRVGLHAAPVLAAVLVLVAALDAPAFSPETHVWIGQEVLKEAQQGFVEVQGRRYAVDEALAAALRAHPGTFLAGHIGADVFPDPVVGQMTTHPGLADGWQTDRFLRHVLQNARTPEELSFAYGFIGHAAGDIFAHTYVNRYAGDIFLLTDGEETVELRHFLLEKYIGQKTPPIARSRGAFKVPAGFVRDTLIFDRNANAQNRKASGTASHLVAAFEVHQAVTNLEREAERARDHVRDAVAGYVKLHVDLAAGLPQLKLGLAAASAALQAAEAGLGLEQKALEEAVNTLKTGNETLARNRQIISINERLIAGHARVIADVAGAVVGLRARVGDAQAQANALATKLANTPARTQQKVCEQVKKVPVLGPLLKETVCRVTDVLTDAWIRVNNELGAAKNSLIRAQSELDQAMARQAQATAEKARLEAINLAKAKETAVLEATTRTLQAAADLKAAEATIKQQLVDSAQQGVKDAKEALARIEKEVDKVKKLIDEAADFLAKLDPITAFIGNWRRDIERAMAEFVRVGLEVGVSTVRREGATVSLYVDWWQCWAPVFQGTPSVVPQAACALKEAYNDAVGWLLDRLGDAAWVLVPGLKLREIIDNEVKQALPKAVAEFVKFTTGKGDLARMLELMGSKDDVSDAQLVRVFERDGTSKGLLTIPDVIQRVAKDLALTQAGTFDPAKFHPARNAVILAKLALLDRAQLNAVYRDLVGPGSTVYGPTLYPETGTERFSLLFDAVRSIDGNHQWQEVALPYPRRRSVKDWFTSPIRYGYGRPPADRGFRFWVDDTARSVFFGNVFTGPQSPGLDTHQFLGRDYYPFVECERNPFPRASEDGQIIREDLGCADTGVRLWAGLRAFAMGTPRTLVRVGGDEMPVVDDLEDMPAIRWGEAAVVAAAIALCLYVLVRPAWGHGGRVLVVIGSIGLLLGIGGRLSAPISWTGAVILCASGAAAIVRYRRGKAPVDTFGQANSEPGAGS